MFAKPCFSAAIIFERIPVVCPVVYDVGLWCKQAVTFYFPAKLGSCRAIRDVTEGGDFDLK